MEFYIEDEKVEELYPITLTKAGFDIIVGGYTLYNLLKEYFPNCKIKYKTRDYLKKIVSRTSPCEKIEDKNAIVLSSRTVPSLKNMKKIKEGKDKLDLLNFPFETIIWNKKILEENLKFKSKKFGENNNLFLGENVSIAENVVFDTKEGIIILDNNVEIFPFNYIKGPTYIGKGTKVKEHSSIKSSYIGNDCRVGGEIDGSIIVGYSNKVHFGFLGDSFVGSWVNLGAGTTNSNLKNTYGTLNVVDGKGKKIKTDEQFLGCIIGDFSKTAINTSIFTGKTIGVNSSISGTIIEDVGSFILNMKEKKVFLIEKAKQTQKRMFDRRNIKQMSEDKELLEKVFNITAKDRAKFIKNRK